MHDEVVHPRALSRRGLLLLLLWLLLLLLLLLLRRRSFGVEPAASSRRRPAAMVPSPADDRVDRPRTAGEQEENAEKKGTDERRRFYSPSRCRCQSGRRLCDDDARQSKSTTHHLWRRRDFFLSIISEVVERDAQQHDELYSTSILRRRRRLLLHQESRLSVLLKGSRFSLSRTKESKWKKKKRGNSTLSFQNPKLLVYLGFWSKGLSLFFVSLSLSLSLFLLRERDVR